MIRRIAFLFCALLFSAFTAEMAQAQYPYGGDIATWNGWGGGYGYGYGYLGTRVGFVPQPPYYSIHPPVYYSAQIIRRPYGYSPFAWPATYPAFNTQMIEARSSMSSEPAVFINPYVPGANGAGQLPPPRTQSGVQPQLIVNPYVVSKAVATK